MRNKESAYMCAYFGLCGVAFVLLLLLLDL